MSHDISLSMKNLLALWQPNKQTNICYILWCITGVLVLQGHKQKNIITEAMSTKKLWLRPSASLLLQSTLKRDRQREAREGWGPGGELKATNWDDIYLVPTPYPVKACVLHWRPVFSQFHPRVEQIEGCEQSTRDYDLDRRLLLRQFP